MKHNNNYGLSQKDKDRGYTDGEPGKDEELLDERPLNTTWSWPSEEDGGFLGRPKGGER